MKKYLWPMSGLVATVLAGVVVVIAPFALHLNPGGHWTQATDTMFWSGVGVIVIGIAALMMWHRDLAKKLSSLNARLRLVAPPELTDTASDPSPAEPEVSKEAAWEANLAKLAEAVLQDLKTEATTPPPKPREAASDDLQALTSALLQDLSQRMEYADADSGQGRRY